MSERSFNEIAQDIIDRDPGAKSLVEEWFTVLAATDERKHAALRDLYGAARSLGAAIPPPWLGQRWHKAMGEAKRALLT